MKSIEDAIEDKIRDTTKDPMWRLIRQSATPAVRDKIYNDIWNSIGTSVWHGVSITLGMK